MDYVIGDTISALVTALTKAKHGKQVALYLPQKGVGGGFAGMNLNGRTLDFGIRVFELAFCDPKEEPHLPLDTFDPVHARHKNYVSHIRAFVTELLGDNIKQLAPPRILRQGKNAQCIFYETDLSALRTLFPPDEQRHIVEQTQRLATKPLPATFGPQLHTDEGLSPKLERLSVEEVSRASHGEYLHSELYRPLERKFLHPERYPEGLKAVPASLYAKFWFKLFHPEDIAACFDPSRTPLRLYRPFHYPKHGGFNSFLEQLTQQTLGHPLITHMPYQSLTSMRAEGTYCAIRFEGAENIETKQNRITLCASPAVVFGGMGIHYKPAAIEWGIAWVEVNEEDVLEAYDILTIVDEDIPALRISTGGETPHKGKVLFTIEFANMNIAEPYAAACIALERAGIIREGSVLEPVHHFKGRAMPHYSAAMLESWQDAKAQFEKCGLHGISYTGGMQNFYADTLNDHILQGLYYGSK